MSTEIKKVRWRSVTITPNSPVIPTKNAWRVLLINKGSTDVKIGNEGENTKDLVIYKKVEDAPPYERWIDTGEATYIFESNMEAEFDTNQGQLQAIIYQLADLTESHVETLPKRD